MSNKKNKKAGFTLVELMVVAIIVAILAAVAVPLMTGNQSRAAATEGQAGCSALATAQRMYRAEYGSYTNVEDNITFLPGIQTGDLNGTYFSDGDYDVSTTADGGFTVTVTSSKATNPEGMDGNKLRMTVSSQGAASWSGQLIGREAVPD